MKVLQIGAYIPENILTNEMLSERFNVSTEWIYKRTNIKKRFLSNTSILDMGIKASKNLDLNGVDAVLFASSIGPHYVPNYVSAFKALNIKTAKYGIDISNGFVGFITAVHTAEIMMKEKLAKRVLIIISEKLSDLTDKNDINTAILFSDAAIAMVVETENYDYEHKTNYDYSLYPALNVNKDKKIEMNGKTVYRFAVKNMNEIIKKFLTSKTKLIVPHQANGRILNSVSKQFSGVKFLNYIEETGNTGAASIPLALYKYYGNKSFSLKNHILVSVGGGMTASGITWRCFNEDSNN
ncbi:3-oxoacyl-[acyl-carrier-protein] synthase 3 [Tepiditoga spiralis]|uniref:3-oxoacyl-[acyl-carrier-protein] synthase 3 n=1 Tax=Tepiditoga spiralis TaxID=2108365 RepID=A0A7G1G610_9BACT|nr:3-oxoacyl-[acyl-carrier-protein] synthase III C-terminal domain-containing protein [Tepiditoga spiralis]BBE30524.1 3-oxoacyl-[acyl-carrier-protein] synthase 3 [Tepiditoga spiralis]